MARRRPVALGRGAAGPRSPLCGPEKSPWEKLRRAMFMPASNSFSIMSGDCEAGPMVHTRSWSWRVEGSLLFSFDKAVDHSRMPHSGLLRIGRLSAVAEVSHGVSALWTGPSSASSLPLHGGFRHFSSSFHVPQSERSGRNSAIMPPAPIRRGRERQVPLNSATSLVRLETVRIRRSSSRME